MIKTVLKLLVLVLPVCICAEPVKKEKKIDVSIGSYALPALATTFEMAYETEQGEWRIALSDGSQWTIKTPMAREEIVKTWSVGDDIRIKESEEEHSEKFILKNVRTRAAYLADLSESCLYSQYAMFVEKIDLKNGYALITTGGVEWAIGYWGSFSSQRWRPGDRIIINKSYFSDVEDYTLINVRDGSSCWGSIVTWN